MIISQTDFLNAIQAGDPSCRNPWAEGRSPHLCRIFNFFNKIPALQGPTLDIGSEKATFFRPLKKFRPELLPYLCADLDGATKIIDGVRVEGHKFECDRDRLPLESNTVGLVLLCDVLEHLLVDPVWTFLEVNRVLRPGGFFVISTPNVAGIERAIKVLQGYHPGTEHHYKPTCLYERHNREWTPSEIVTCLYGLGFDLSDWETNEQAIPSSELQVLEVMRHLGVVKLENKHFGPDIITVMQKIKHITLETPLPDDVRWPNYLYTGYECYRRRPDYFPIIKPTESEQTARPIAAAVEHTNTTSYVENVAPRSSQFKKTPSSPTIAE